MSRDDAREIWCNEAQERYVLAIAPADLDRFA
jgi:phosphoribosylformylglycinamidine synthase